MVELLRRYSNRGDLLDDFNRALAKLDGRAVAAADEEPLDDLVSDFRDDPRGCKLSRRLTSDDVAKLLERYRTGATVQDVAAEFKIGKTSVKRLLRQHEGRRQDWRLTPEFVATVIERYKAGGTIRGLAVEFGVGTTTLKRWIREQGVKRGRLPRAKDC